MALNSRSYPSFLFAFLLGHGPTPLPPNWPYVRRLPAS
jgi:hypothetical protein